MGFTCPEGVLFSLTLVKVPEMMNVSFAKAV